MSVEYICYVIAKARSASRDFRVREHGMENKLTSFFVNFLVRAVIGMAVIFFINQYVIPGQTGWHVGLNVVSFLTSGGLGIPGVCLLYGILVFQSL